METKDTRPPEGSTYTYRSKDPDNAYNGYTGKVVYESDGSFSLTDGSSWLVICERRPIKRVPEPPRLSQLFLLYIPLGLIGMGFCISTNQVGYAYLFGFVTFCGVLALGYLFLKNKFGGL